MKINEVSKKYQLSLSTLRYYEKIGLLDPVERISGIRQYGESDFDRIEFILCMKESGLSLEMIKEYFDLYKEGDHTLEKRLALLQKQEQETKEKLERVQATLDYIHYKMGLTKSNIKKRDKAKSEPVKSR
ncbi:MerR family transcriptional regulator [Enterococcus sp. BWR-S5]|uniref:MerR family transcriptional regulator n=1 Tax=Enterococcus sp. BWR-S5 TaxID=2787714 RepID=UPI0019219B4D|nr:MerR family transcriptional regulator [Enterococcus sp. BWR-S5]MBL1225259.1 MerR family transcriptional regulator [Enterococcus sp. BWR-S5]